MANLTTPVRTFDWIFWDKNVYYSRYIVRPTQHLDCMNECVNVQRGVCQMFVFENGICYLARSDITNGTVSNKPSNATVYSVTSMYIKCKAHQL